MRKTNLPPPPPPPLGQHCGWSYMPQFFTDWEFYICENVDVCLCVRDSSLLPVPPPPSAPLNYTNCHFQVPEVGGEFFFVVYRYAMNYRNYCIIYR